MSDGLRYEMADAIAALIRKHRRGNTDHWIDEVAHAIVDSVIGGIERASGGDAASSTAESEGQGSAPVDTARPTGEGADPTLEIMPVHRILDCTCETLGRRYCPVHAPCW